MKRNTISDVLTSNTSNKSNTVADSGIVFAPYIMDTVHSINDELYVSDDGEYKSWYKKEIDRYNNQKLSEKLDKLGL